MSEYHARLSPSGAHRWMRCPASIELSAAVKDRGSRYAAEGTVAHGLAAKALHEDDRASYIAAYLGVEIDGVVVDLDMIEAVGVYCAIVAHYEGDLMVEQQVPIHHLTGEIMENGEPAHGTADALIISRDGDLLTVVDLKYGQGVRVDAENNPQLMMYALGALEVVALLGHAPSRVRLVISQPRLGTQPSESLISVADLALFADQVRAAAARCVSGAVAVPGEKQCRFCPAKASCPALAEQVLAQVAGDFIDLDAPLVAQIESDGDSRLLSVEQLGECMSAVALVESWCLAIRARVEGELLSGRPVPGWKLVEGRRGARQWIDERDADAALLPLLADERFAPRKLLSPAQAEKIMAKDDRPMIADLTRQVDGKPSVAPIDDKRPAIAAGAAAHDFDVLGDDE